MSHYSARLGILCHATPPYIRGRHGGVEKRGGVENLMNDTPPQKWVLDPPVVRYVFHPPHRADQKLFWRGLKFFGGARSLVRFPPPIRFAPPHITAQLYVR